MTAKSYLSQAMWLDSRINCRVEEAIRLREKLSAGRTSKITGMPRGGGGDWTDTMCKLIALEKQIDADIGRLIDVKSEIMAAIESVRDIRYKTLLELRYRSFWGWDKIADEMHYNKRWVLKMHGEALKQIKIPKQATKRHSEM